MDQLNAITAKDYIDVGFYTVPISGKLQRDAAGKKFGIFLPRWQRYNTEFNTADSTVVAAIPGEASGFCCIDCDDTESLEEIRTLLTEHSQEYVELRSVGNKVAASFLFKWQKSLDFNMSGTKDDKLEFFGSGKRIIYLPSSDNYTKDIISSKGDKLTDDEWRNYIANLPELNINIANKLRLIKLDRASAKEASDTTLAAKGLVFHTQPYVHDYLTESAPLLSVEKTEKLRLAMDYLLPSDYRDRVPFEMDLIGQGEGSDFLMRVMARLAVDESIDESTATSFIVSLNSRWQEIVSQKIARDEIIEKWEGQIKASVLFNTIINRHVKGQAKLSGESFWRYDPEWETKQLVFKDPKGGKIFVYNDLSVPQNPFILYSTRTNRYDRGLARAQAVAQLRNRTKVDKIKGSDLELSATSVRVIHNIFKPEGYSRTGEEDAVLNLAIKSEALKILQGEKTIIDYTEPKLFIDFMEHLIVGKEDREYFLRFMKTKLTTGKHSELIHLFLGPQGTGKSTISELFGELLLTAYKAPTAKVMKEKHNQFMEGAVVVNIDEISASDSTKEKIEFYETLKAYTGKARLSIRAMGTNEYSVDNLATFIITTNSYEMPLEDDRRHILYEAPTKLKDAKFLPDYPELRKYSVLDLLKRDINNIAEYIRLREPLGIWEYTNSRESKQKAKLAMSFMSPIKVLLFALKEQDTEVIMDLIIEKNLKAQFNAELQRNELTGVVLNHLAEEKFSTVKWNNLLASEGITMTPSISNANKLCVKLDKLSVKNEEYVVDSRF